MGAEGPRQRAPGRIRRAGDLPGIIDGATVTEEAAQGTQVGHLPVAVEKSMTDAGGRVAATHHLARVVEARADTAAVSRQCSQVRDAIEDVGGEGVTRSEQQGQKKAGSKTHRLHSFDVAATLSQKPWPRM